MFIDPFHSGALLDRAGCRRQITRLLGPDVGLTDQHLAPCHPAQVVARMLGNLKSIYLQSHEFHSAIPIQRRLAALRHDDPVEQRDLGLLFLRAHRPAAAVAPLQAYLDALPAPADAEHIASLLRTAHRDVALRN